MRLSTYFIFFTFLATPSFGEAYRILGIFPFNGASHFTMFGKLMEELAMRGHQVDVVSHFPRKKPLANYNDIVSLAGTLPNLQNNMTYDFATHALDDDTLVFSIATQFGGNLCVLMDQPKFKELINNPPNDPPYDVAIIEIFGANCYLALGRHMKVPIVGVVSSPLWPWAGDMVANPENPAYTTHVLSGPFGKLHFWDRFKNTLMLWKTKWNFSHYTANQNDMIKKHIGPHAPSLTDAENDVSLILVNSHYSLHGVRPFTTAVVEVGGLHIRENEAPSPDDLQKWLDESTDGFILITFGSMVKIETFPKETIFNLYSAIRKFPSVRFLIKVVNKNELPPGLPSNVLTLNWIPQSSVIRSTSLDGREKTIDACLDAFRVGLNSLNRSGRSGTRVYRGHKNIRAFMTHGGLMGTQEAIYHGVPMIGVPLFADQHQNIRLYVQKKIAISIDHNQLTEENLSNAFNSILYDPSYMESVKRLSAEFRDRPMSAADTAVFWIEYIIRNGEKSLRSHATDLAWWQIALFDVYGAMLAIIALVIYFLKVIIFKLKSELLRSDRKRTSRTRKNQ